MKVLSTLGILLIVTGCMALAIGKLEVDEYLNSDIDTMRNMDELEVNEKKLKTPLEGTINVNEDNLNSTEAFKKLLVTISSLNATAKDSKFSVCAYKGVKEFLVCELHGADGMEDPVGFVPFIKCASAGAMEFVNCFFHASASLQNLREDMRQMKDANAMYKTLDKIMKMFMDFEDSNVQDTVGTDYYFGYDDTPPEVNYNSLI